MPRLDRRITDAGARQIEFPPKLEGITWREDDPLAGIPEAIPPFGRVDDRGLVVKQAAAAGSGKGSRPRTPKPPTPSPAPAGPAGTPPAVGQTPKGVPSRERVREAMKGAFGEPTKYGPGTKDWWKNLPDPRDFEFDAVAKQVAKMLIKNVVNAAPAGREKAARRMCLKLASDGIASVAVAITTDAIQQIVDPETGMRRYVYRSAPEPNDDRIVAEEIADDVAHWHEKGDRELLATARGAGKQIARNTINVLPVSADGPVARGPRDRGSCPSAKDARPAAGLPLRSPCRGTAVPALVQ